MGGEVGEKIEQLANKRDQATAIFSQGANQPSD